MYEHLETAEDRKKVWKVMRLLPQREREVLTPLTTQKIPGGGSDGLLPSKNATCPFRTARMPGFGGPLPLLPTALPQGYPCKASFAVTYK